MKIDGNVVKLFAGKNRNNERVRGFLGEQYRCSRKQPCVGSCQQDCPHVLRVAVRKAARSMTEQTVEIAMAESRRGIRILTRTDVLMARGDAA